MVVLLKIFSEIMPAYSRSDFWAHLSPPKQISPYLIRILFYPRSCVQLTQMPCLPRHDLRFCHCHIHNKCNGQKQLHFIQSPYGMPFEPVIPVYPSVDPFHSRPFFIQPLPLMAAARHRREDSPVFLTFDPENSLIMFLRFKPIP